MLTSHAHFNYNVCMATAQKTIGNRAMPINAYAIGPCRQKLSNAIRQLEARLTEQMLAECKLKCPYNWHTSEAIYHLTGLESEIQKMNLWALRPANPYQWVLDSYPLPESVCNTYLHPEALNLWALFLAAPLTQREQARKLFESGKY